MYEAILRFVGFVVVIVGGVGKEGRYKVVDYQRFGSVLLIRSRPDTSYIISL